jgi:hypothetical protein
VKRLEAALKAFGPGFHVYQYLFKSNRPDIPFAKFDDWIVEAAIEQPRKFFEAKRDHLYRVEIFYCILLDGSRLGLPHRYLDVIDQNKNKSEKSTDCEGK